VKIYVVEALINKCDETLPIINKSEHPRKGEYNGREKGKDPCPRRQKNHQKSQNIQLTNPLLL
jgi:hypothetical protein